jgi:hypothetical protein
LWKQCLRSVFLLTGNQTERERELDREVAFYYSNAFSDNTKRTYTTHRNSYINFCAQFGYAAVPASSNTICRYAAFLAKSLKFNSVKQYLNIIRLLHAEWNLPNPLSNDFRLTTMLQGIRRHLGDNVVRKRPITPAMLLAIKSALDFTNSLDSTVWAVALTMFYGLLRKSNVLPSLAKAFHPDKQLRLCDITYHNWGIRLHVRWSKTNQFQSKSLDIPLPRLQHHRLCPVQAIFHAARQTAGADPFGPAFLCVIGGNAKPLTSEQFIVRIRQCLEAAGIPSSNIASHSFRRGGATFGYSIGLSPDAIKLLGDWRSNCYQQYISDDFRQRFRTIQLMQRAIKDSL